jgi:hypothetical protein
MKNAAGYPASGKNQQEKSAMSEDPQGFSRLSQDMPGCRTFRKQRSSRKFKLI